MTTPLQVYLDSSDFSRYESILSGRNSSEDAEIFAKLVAFQASGDVEFRFSYTHVSEAGPITDHAVPYAIGRGQAIQQLCGKRVFVPYFYLPILEIAAIQNGMGAIPARDRVGFNGRNNNGAWFPELAATLAEVQDEFTAATTDPLSILAKDDPSFTPNRAMRRKSAQKVARGDALRLWRETINEAFPAKIERLRDLFPIGESTEKVLRHFLLQQATAEDISNAMSLEMSDLANVMLWLAPTGNSPLRDIPNWLRASGAKHQAAIATGRKLVQQQLKSGMTPDQIRQQINAVGFIEKFEAAILSEIQLTAEREVALLKRLSIDLYKVNLHVEKHWPFGFPSYAALLSAVVENMQTSLAVTGVPRSLDKVSSDMGDVMHAAYIPYVHIFRADGYSSTYLSAIGKKFNTLIVDKLQKLPQAIGSLLNHS